MFQLAGNLMFDVKKDGEKPVHRDGLSIEQAEAVLNTWKLRGLHGG